MREHKRHSAVIGWLTAAIIAALMLGTFVLAGGLGSDQSSVIHAGAQTTTSGNANDPLTGATIVVSGCAGPSVTGTVTLRAPTTGSFKLKLYMLSPTVPGTFGDTGQRTTVSFSNSSSAPFTFPTLAVPAAAYQVMLIESDGVRIGSVPVSVCQVVTQTATTTTTTTTSSTSPTTTTTTSTTNSDTTTTTQTFTNTAISTTTTTTTTTTFTTSLN